MQGSCQIELCVQAVCIKCHWLSGELRTMHVEKHYFMLWLSFSSSWQRNLRTTPLWPDDSEKTHWPSSRLLDEAFITIAETWTVALASSLILPSGSRILLSNPMNRNLGLSTPTEFRVFLLNLSPLPWNIKRPTSPHLSENNNDFVFRDISQKVIEPRDPDGKMNEDSQDCRDTAAVFR